MKVASLSYGKDSLRMIDTIMEHGYPLDKVLHTEIWATDTISADLPPMVEFKQKADEILKARYGITVERVRAKRTFEEQFYVVKGARAKPKNQGKIYGFPRILGSWCVGMQKTKPMEQAKKGCTGEYIGYAIDEKNPTRQEKVAEYLANGHPIRIFPLVDRNITEQECYDWCKNNDLLSPIYTDSARGGCWFCPKQSLPQLRFLRQNYPEYWSLLLKWDRDNPWGDFNIRYTVAGLEQRFFEETSQLSIFKEAIP